MLSRKGKVLAAGIAATVLITTPAFASKAKKKKVSHPAAYASKSQRTFDPNAVYGWDGGYRGSDPDPNIRFQLTRDQNMPNN